MCRIAQNAGGGKHWQNPSTRVFKWENFVELRKCSINVVTTFKWEYLNESMGDSQIHQCFPSQKFCTTYLIYACINACKFAGVYALLFAFTVHKLCMHACTYACNVRKSTMFM